MKTAKHPNWLQPRMTANVPAQPTLQWGKEVRPGAPSADSLQCPRAEPYNSKSCDWAKEQIFIFTKIFLERRRRTCVAPQSDTTHPPPKTSRLGARTLASVQRELDAARAPVVRRAINILLELSRLSPALFSTQIIFQSPSASEAGNQRNKQAFLQIQKNLLIFGLQLKIKNLFFKLPGTLFWHNKILHFSCHKMWKSWNIKFWACSFKINLVQENKFLERHFLSTLIFSIL